MILGIDTSTLRASVALVDGDIALAERESEVRTHSERIIALIDEVLAEAGRAIADVEGVAVGAGPGSFTGLRIGMATAKGLCFAADKPLWAVSSLAALALGAGPRPGLLVPVLDARRKEVFVGFYRSAGDGVERVAAEAVMSPAAVAAAVAEVGDDAVLFGDGVDLYRDVLSGAGALLERPGRPTHPLGADVARLAARADPADLAAVAPVYIRKSEAEIRYPDGNPGGSFKPIP